MRPVNKSTNLTNYHSHSLFCDGKANAESFIIEAINSGFYSYGISSHAPLPFDTKWTMQMKQLEAYVKEINDLKLKYKDQIEIYLGMEIDYLSSEHNPSSPLFKNLPLDYSIGSVHLIDDDNGEITDVDVKPEIFAEFVKDRFNNDLKKLINRYFDKKILMIETGGFNILGHADKISMNASFVDPDVTSARWYVDRVNDYLHFIADKKQIIEINTKAFISKGFLFPNIQHFRLIRDLKIPVMVNSDSHYTNLINSGRPEALKALKEIGIDEVIEIRDGKFEAVPISPLYTL